MIGSSTGRSVALPALAKPLRQRRGLSQRRRARPVCRVVAVPRSTGTRDRKGHRCEGQDASGAFGIDREQVAGTSRDVQARITRFVCRGSLYLIVPLLAERDRMGGRIEGRPDRPASRLRLGGHGGQENDQQCRPCPKPEAPPGKKVRGMPGRSHAARLTQRARLRNRGSSQETLLCPARSGIRKCPERTPANRQMVPGDGIEPPTP